jgi:hypothetical protein
MQMVKGNRRSGLAAYQFCKKGRKNMTCLVTLPNCRHNIVINTLFVKPEAASGVNILWLFQSFILWVEILPIEIA